MTTLNTMYNNKQGTNNENLISLLNKLKFNWFPSS